MIYTDFFGFTTGNADVDGAINTMECELLDTERLAPNFDVVKFEDVRTESLETSSTISFIMCDGEVKEFGAFETFNAFQILTSEVWTRFIEHYNSALYWREVESLVYAEAMNNSDLIYDLAKVAKYRGYDEAVRNEAKQYIIERMGFGSFWNALVVNEACTGYPRAYLD